MNDNYFYEYANMLERVLSTAHELKYSTAALEKLISYSPYFQKVEDDSDCFAPIITENQLIKEIFSEVRVDVGEIPVYNQCLWAAESYLHIQDRTGLTFETLFLYIPIAKMYEYFHIYHEMDFSQIINEFIRIYKEKSILDILCEKYGYSMKCVGEKTDIPYETLLSFKQRKRDISKANYETVYKLSKIFHIRSESIAEIKNNNF